jgi:hypothetical protein
MRREAPRCILSIGEEQVRQACDELIQQVSPSAVPLS